MDHQIDINYEKKYEQILKQIILERLAPYKCRVVLFGSHATGKYTISSDYDVGIEGLPDGEFKKVRSSILDNIEESLVPHKVDLVNFDEADQAFKVQALKKVIEWKAA